MKREPANRGNPGRYIGNNYEQTARLSRSPDTSRGALESWRRQRAKFYCPNHPETLQTVVDVAHIKRQPTAAHYDVTLECGCRRVVTINLKPTPVAYVVPVMGTGETEVA